MQIGKINLHDPDLYKIPEYNWQKFQRCLIMDAGIGFTVEDVMRRADTIAVMAVNKRDDDLHNELANLKLSLFSAMEGINYNTMAFACLVQDIEGEKFSIATDADINALSKRIADTGILVGEIATYVELVKKKLIRN